MTSAIILAAGSSTRMGGINKQFAKLSGVPVFVMSAAAFQRSDNVGEIIIAAPLGDADRCRALCEKHGITKLKAVIEGGQTRFLSVKNALSQVSSNADFIAIHDGARPLIQTADIDRVIQDARVYGAAIAACAATDTVKTAEGGFVTETPPRSSLFYAQTPQVFRAEDYRECVKKLGREAEQLTDDSLLLERCGKAVHITELTACNMKITRPQDLAAAEAIIAQGKEKGMRIGQGYDVHRLVEGRRLVLCGVEIPYEKGLLGHSDADVAVHALMDAVLGALALGDIGKLFPDTDPAYEGADSMALLAEVIRLMRESGYTLGNLDITIVAERPKLARHIPAMRESLAAAFECNVDRISVKATTEEGLGLAGEGIAAKAVVLLEQK